MFDNIICEQPLPDGFEIAKGAAFQSKDFCCEMDTYTITRNGRLTRRYISGYEPTPESQWKYNNPNGVIEEIWHEQSKKKPIHSICDVNFHGWMSFYTCTGSRELGTWKWHEYRAKFTDGSLVEIMSVPDETD